MEQSIKRDMTKTAYGLQNEKTVSLSCITAMQTHSLEHLEKWLQQFLESGTLNIFFSVKACDVY